MQKMVVLVVCLLLSSCAFFGVHKMDIEQGNIITPEMLSRIHTGMSAAQIKEIMGSPVLDNVFDKNRYDYVYTFKPGYGEGHEKYVTILFNGGRVRDIRVSEELSYRN